MIRVKQDADYTYYKAVNTGRMQIVDLKTDLTGNYQNHNLKTILTAVELVQNNGFNLPFQQTLEALTRVKELTGLRGRWEYLQKEPPVICDVAHNPAGLYEVLRQLWYVPAHHKHIVLGFVKDKEVEEALKLFPHEAIYYFCNAQIPRALPADELFAIATKMGLNGNYYPSVNEAVMAAKHQMTNEDALLITGSFFVVAEAMEYSSKIL